MITFVSRFLNQKARLLLILTGENKGTQIYIFSDFSATRSNAVC